MSRKTYHSDVKLSQDFALRLKKLRKSLGLTQGNFGNKIGVVQGFISDIEKGKKQPSDVVINAICASIGVKEDWLRYGVGEMFSVKAETEQSAPVITPIEGVILNKIPILRKVMKDFPDSIAEEDIVGYLLSSEIPANCYAVKAHGDFMSPTIRDSDSVIFTPEHNPDSGDIVLLSNLWGDIIIRRYRRTDDGRFFFTPDNTIFKPFQGDSSTRIVGKVIDIWRRIKL